VILTKSVALVISNFTTFVAYLSILRGFVFQFFFMQTLVRGSSIYLLLCLVEQCWQWQWVSSTDLDLRRSSTFSNIRNSILVPAAMVG